MDSCRDDSLSKSKFLDFILIQLYCSFTCLIESLLLPLLLALNQSSHFVDFRVGIECEKWIAGLLESSESAEVGIGIKLRVLKREGNKAITLIWRRLLSYHFTLLKIIYLNS